MRAEVELRLLDQEHEVAAGSSARRRSMPATSASPPSAAAQWRSTVGGWNSSATSAAPRPGGRRDERPRAEVRRQEQHRRRTSPVEVERVGRPGVEEDRPLRDVGLRAGSRPPRRFVAGDVVDGRRRCGGLEQRPDRGQHGRLAARRLPHERAHGAGRELELARGAIPLDRDASERRRHAP